MDNKASVNLDVNPCKMCMPMGAVMAFKGIEGNMVILHGSQGCSTYIRRHMATHYNEPIDIASSSLTENGTIYGGTKNLKIGLKNMIKMYNPKTIGVMTTCLAETIGEDIKRITREFKDEEAGSKNLDDLKIITVSTPGYGGTQNEGYYRAIRSIVEQLAIESEKTNKINIIAANLNPGDIRNIKNILEVFGVEYTMLPDVSNTLDGPHSKEYNRLPKGGTKLSDIEKMGGALGTIEMGDTISKADSAGTYLEEKYKVPLYTCGIPIGIRNTDKFLSIISEISGKPIPESFKVERGRYLDAMIDSHKYNGEAKAILYGEPELVLAVTKVCAENGIQLKLVALGTRNEKFKKAIQKELEKQSEAPIIIDDTDFETIERYSKALEVNVIIGNSDGRRMAERMDLKIVRIGFPIHDRVGAQRKVITGYNGSAALLDDIANTILEQTESSFRKEAYEKYFDPEKEKKNMIETVEIKEKEIDSKNNFDKNDTHPCFGTNAHSYARMHIPVAPKCNISCNYCTRKYDCANESRPGVTSEVLTPEQALEKYKYVKSKMPNLTVVGIAGPGDALANFEQTKKSIQLIKKEDKEITFCLSTNGLMLPFYANDLVELGVSHVTVTINAVDKKIGAQIYRKIDYLGKTYTGEEAAEILINNQFTGLSYLASKGIVCKVNIVMVKGINDTHVEEVIKKAKECGVYVTNIMQMIPVEGSVFENMPMVSLTQLNEMRKKCGAHVKQMYHCKQCRADAIGTLENDKSAEFRDKGCLGSCSGSLKIEDSKINKIYKIAIASKSGLNIDEHFGHANEFHIYSYDRGSIRYLEKRDIDKYCTGNDECFNEEDKIDKIIKIISDCDAVLALRVGMEPRKKLETKGIKIVQMYDSINEGIRKVIKDLS